MSENGDNDRLSLQQILGDHSLSLSEPAKGKRFHINVGLVFASVIGGSAVILSAICLPFVTPALRKVCLPYVPATTTQVINVFKALEGRTGRLIDLGSGDGRIVLQAAMTGFKGFGVELNPWLVIYSKYQAFHQGLSASASFHRKNIWKTPLNHYENVIIFGVDSMMDDLEKKCQAELEQNSVVIACRFPFPTLKPTIIIGEGIDTVWKYNFSKCS